jgi:hypothetical protein
VKYTQEEIDAEAWRIAGEEGVKRYNGGGAFSPEPLWPVLGKAAYHGLAGDVVSTIAPHSEADPAAIVIQFLVAAGNIIGRSRYYQVESDHHHANLFVVLVGPSSKARKGTSLGRIMAVVSEWASERFKGGLSSGEGLINEVRDKIEKWNVKEDTLEIIDPGVKDKRLFVVEPEFAGALAVMERHGNTLSPLLRRSWDGDKLSTMTRNSPLVSTGAHVSIVAHITETELRARLTARIRRMDSPIGSSSLLSGGEGAALRRRSHRQPNLLAR